MNKNLLTTREVEIRNELMQRVRTVNSTRTFIVSPAVGLLCAGLFLFVASFVVSMSDVFHNIMAHGEWSGRFNYTYSSLLNSRIIVQVLASLTLLSLALVLVRSLRFVRTPFFMVGNFLVSYSPLKFFRS